MSDVLLLCTLSLSAAAAAEWHVAVDGRDDNDGSAAAPFGSVMRAQQSARPGDTVLIGGGTYRMQGTAIARIHKIWAYVILLDKSGEPGRPITYAARAGERPVFDFSDVRPEGLRVHAFEVTGSWIHLRGLEVTGVQVTVKGHTQSICFSNNGSHNLYERLSMYDGQAIGIYSVRGSNNLFLNCDAWNNHDFTSGDGLGGNTDGFGCHPPRGSTNNVFRGCRAWFNSDDGFDCINAHEAVVFEHCLAFYNGYSKEFKNLADGNGFKAGGYAATPAERLPPSIPRHVVRFCMAVRNKAYGFYANHHPGGCDWIHNSAFRNRNNFNMLGRLTDNRTGVPGFGHRLHNNLGYRSRDRQDLIHCNAAECALSNNSFDGSAVLTDADFVSLDERQLVQPRLDDGSLPALTFLQPVEGGNACRREKCGM